MRWRSLAVCLASVPTMHCASSYVRGHVSSCRGASPLEGAEVQLTSDAPGVEWGAEETGSDGAYAFDVGHAKDILPVKLTVAKKGYQTTQKTYSSVPGGAEDVCLQPTIR